MFQRRRHRTTAMALAAGIGIASQVCCTPHVQAAKDVALVSGAFRRSIPVKEIEHLAETGEPIGLLKNLLSLSGQDPAEVAKLLNQKINII